MATSDGDSHLPTDAERRCMRERFGLTNLVVAYLGHSVAEIIMRETLASSFYRPGSDDKDIIEMMKGTHFLTPEEVANNAGAYAVASNSLQGVSRVREIVDRELKETYGLELVVSAGERQFGVSGSVTLDGQARALQFFGDASLGLGVIHTRVPGNLTTDARTIVQAYEAIKYPAPRPAMQSGPPSRVEITGLVPQIGGSRHIVIN